MTCPWNDSPFGYHIQHSNNPSCQKWLVMRWGVILNVCDTLEEAYLFLVERLGEEVDGTTSTV